MGEEMMERKDEDVAFLLIACVSSSGISVRPLFLRAFSAHFWRSLPKGNLPSPSSSTQFPQPSVIKLPLVFLCLTVFGCSQWQAE